MHSLFYIMYFHFYDYYIAIYIEEQMDVILFQNRGQQTNEKNVNIFYIFFNILYVLPGTKLSLAHYCS